MKKQDKILWLSIIQGWAILLVVIGHVGGYNYEGDGTQMYAMSYWIHRFCYSFHMPLFMFVSGGLLYYSRISKNWGVTALYKDKIKRLLLPFILFTVIGFVLKALVAGSTKRGMEVSFESFVNAFFDPASGPMNELWFLGTLMWLMMLYPLYRTILKNPWTEIILLAITLIPFVFNITLDIYGWFNIKGVFNYAFFFFAGILFFKYDIPHFFEMHKWVAPVLTMMYACAFLLEGVPSIIVASLGILMSIGWGVWIANIYPGIFNSFRDHSFQIYLFGIFPQMLVELFVWKRFHTEWGQPFYYIVSCLLAIYLSCLLSKVVSRIPLKYIRWGWGLK